MKTLFVANLPFGVTEGDLWVHFGAYAPERVHLVEDKGIAFLEIPEDRLQEAIDEKHDAEMAGRRLTVNEARPRG